MFSLSAVLQHNTPNNCSFLSFGCGSSGEKWLMIFTLTFWWSSSLRKLRRMAVFQHGNHPKRASKMTTAFLRRLEGKVSEWPSMSPDLNQAEQQWGILQQRDVGGGRARCLQHPPAPWSHHGAGRGRGLQRRRVQFWWIPCPRGFKPVWGNNGTHTKYWCSVTCVASYLDNNGCVELF